MNYQVHTPPNKNHAIEAFRFFFICIICLWHCHDVAPWLLHGYIAVEFYFILSGYFIYQSYLKHPNVGVLDFTWNKVKKFFIPFVISVLLLMLLDRKQYLFCHDLSADGILETYFSHVHEFFFCQFLGLTDRVAINHPLWFISVLLFGGGVLFSLLKNFGHKAVSLYMPLVCLLGYSFLLSNGNCSLQNRLVLYGMQSWIIRGFSDMGLGIMLSYIIERKNLGIQKKSTLMNVLGCISLFAFILMTCAHGNYDYLAIFFIPLILCACFLETSWFQRVFIHKCWLTLGDLSMYMYFIHLFVASVYWILKDRLGNLGMPCWFWLICYLSFIIMSAKFLKEVSRKVIMRVF